MTKLAICGLGHIGRVHLDNLRSLRGCAVAGIFDVRREVSASLAVQYGLAAYASVDEMLADSAVQAVVVATPTDSHRPLTLAALAAGKHVFVEKPLAGTLADAEAIAAAACASGRCVQAGFCERFNAQYLEAKRAVEAGELGVVRAIYTSRVAPLGLSDPAWQLGVLDTAVHNLDLILWLMGQAPLTVRAEGVSLYDSTTPQSVTTFLRFADGGLATDHITWLRDDHHPLHHCARARLLALGDGGSLEIDLSSRPTAVLTPHAYRQQDTVILGGPEYYGCLKLQFESFLRSIEEGAPVLAPVEDALLAERVVLAAHRSLLSGQEERLA